MFLVDFFSCLLLLVLEIQSKCRLLFYLCAWIAIAFSAVVFDVIQPLSHIGHLSEVLVDVLQMLGNVVGDLC